MISPTARAQFELADDALRIVRTIWISFFLKDFVDESFSNFSEVSFINLRLLQFLDFVLNLWISDLFSFKIGCDVELYHQTLRAFLFGLLMQNNHFFWALIIFLFFVLNINHYGNNLESLMHLYNNNGVYSAVRCPYKNGVEILTMAYIRLSYCIQMHQHSIVKSDFLSFYSILNPILVHSILTNLDRRYFLVFLINFSVKVYILGISQ